MSDRKIRWACLSCANIAKDRTIPSLLRAGNSELIAIAGRQESRRQVFKEMFDPKYMYETYDELLANPEVEAVYIPLTNTLHMEWAIKAMDAGKHVLCEKPLGLNANQVQAMIDASKRNNVLLMEAFSYLYGDVVSKAKEIVDSGVLGEIKHINVDYAFNGVTPDDIRLNRMLGGGVLYDLGCYCVSFIRYILGEEPTDVTVVQGVGEKSLVDEHAMGALKFPGGKTASFYAAFDSFTDSVRTICGTKGTLAIPARYHEFGQITMRLTDEEGRHEIPVECFNHYDKMFKDFGDAIIEGRSPMVSLEYSLGNAMVVDRMMGFR